MPWSEDFTRAFGCFIISSLFHVFVCDFRKEFIMKGYSISFERMLVTRRIIIKKVSYNK